MSQSIEIRSHVASSNPVAESLRAAFPVAPTQTLYTVEQFSAAEPAYSPAALRNLIFKAEPRHSSMGEIPGNGLIECGAIIRRGRKVLIHRERFLEWVQS